MVNLAPKLVSLDETFSVPELQQRTWTRLTGAEIAAHNIAGEPLNILCLEDGSGYLKGHVYVITDDGIIYDVFAPHLHTDNSTGASLYEIKRANYKDDIEMPYAANIFKAAFVMTERSTGTGGLAAGTLDDEVDATAHTKYIKLTTAGTNATSPNEDVTNIQAGGGRLFFGKPVTLQIKYAVSNNTSINYRMGIGQPLIENTVGVGAQMGFEGCTGTNVFNHAFSADGTTWSVGADLTNMVPTGSIPLGLRIDLYPSSKMVVTDGEGASDIKTTNLPPVGTATNADALFRAGVKQLAASTSRWLKIYALRVVGSSYDSQSGIKGWC
jgi:hypothetical protein